MSSGPSGARQGGERVLGWGVVAGDYSAGRKQALFLRLGAVVRHGPSREKRWRGGPRGTVHESRRQRHVHGANPDAVLD